MVNGSLIALGWPHFRVPRRTDTLAHIEAKTVPAPQAGTPTPSSTQSPFASVVIMDAIKAFD